MSITSRHPPLSELIIASMDPSFIERGVLWFKKEYENIKKARETQSFFANNTALIKEKQKISPAECIHTIDDLGYERAFNATKPGTFAQKGGMIELFPINYSHPIRIVFVGNTIEEIIPIESALDEKTRERELKQKFLKEQSLLRTLKEKEYVVHENHGIGIYKGVQHLAHDNEQRYLVIEYAPPRPGAMPDRLFVPTRHIKKISRYIGFTTPAIHRLSSQVWMTTRRKAAQHIIAMAKELLTLYEERERATRHAYHIDNSFEHEVARTFQFEETPDQLQAINDIRNDLESTKPMDRLVCADVGFGKTEVALRASAFAVSAHKQVAILTPTTILADQHFTTFKKRLSHLPVRIALLSRLETKSSQKKIIHDIKEGLIDIVIGTHRLLSKDITFHNLGLLVIDEEQRFGVKQKERLKSIKSSVDVLGLSATPIPRTLHMILSGLKPISIMETPPTQRKAIETIVAPFNMSLAEQAIQEELKRHGQIYWLHNRIETLNNIERAIKKHVHHIRIATIHGRMGEKQLRETMNIFRSKKADLLLATTIIENGLDLTNVNTLIIDDATRLGLSQAHQIRGRIGRSDKKAYAYLFHPQRMTDNAHERLQALSDFAHLGAGFEIAKRDLEIRGAGNILGPEQSGTLNQVGLNLYCEMLARAVEEFSEGKIEAPHL